MKNLYKEERDILFLDIETVPISENFQDLNEVFKREWEKRTYNNLDSNEVIENFWYDKAALYAEFGKIIVISLGFYSFKEKRIHVKSLISQSGDEKQLLITFKEQLETLEQYTKKHKKLLFFMCGHNSIEFDFPYICRRFLINEISLPSVFDIQGAKPWNLERHLDTMQMWKFGDSRGSYISLNFLAFLFQIEVEKKDINSTQIAKIYYSNDENQIEKISNYCKKDVILTANVYHKLLSKPIIAEENIEYKEDIYI